jgi:predicted protein tyrosine phosphatase
VSAIDAALSPTTPEIIASDRHLRLAMHDIVEARAEQVLPAAEHVVQLLDFIYSWDRREPMLIHCYAGISRSTAAAFITLCALNPDTPEELLALNLRRSSDSARPNRLFVALADKALRRNGRMTAAVSGMGQSNVALECVPFGLPAIYGTSGELPGCTASAA